MAQQTIPAAHKLINVPASAASCVKDGNLEYWTCSVCKAVTQTQAETERDPANHDETCATHWENRGNTTGHIQVRTCGAAVGSVAAHSWGRWAAVPPGREERECTVCHAVGVQTYVVGPETDPDPVPGPGADDSEAGLTDIDDERAPLAGLPFDLAPTDELTRGRFAQILYWFEGEPEADGKAPFTDVEGHEYVQAIVWGAANGVLLGYDDGSYRPDNGITRAEMVLILNRYAKYKQADVTVELDGDAADVMIWLEAEGIIDDFFASLEAEEE